MSERTPNFNLLSKLGPSERPGPEEADFLRFTVDYGIPKFFSTDPQGTSGLVYAWFGGVLGDGAEKLLSPPGSKTISPNTVNYFEVDNNGLVASNEAGFTEGKMSLAIVTSDDTEIIEIKDVRVLAGIGPEGKQGIQGEIGPAPGMEAGTVITLPPENNAAVEVEPVPNMAGAYRVNFAIPRGEKGLPGTSVKILGEYGTFDGLLAAHPTGNPGDAYFTANGDMYFWDVDKGEWVNVGNLEGPIGPIGPPPGIEVGDVLTLPPGEDAQVDIYPTSDLPGYYRVDFKIPQGIQGIQGIQGEKGDAASIEFDVSFLPNGQEPFANVTGDGPEYKIELGFPLPLDGLNGEKGEPGDTGPPPVIQAGNAYTLPPGGNAAITIREIGTNVYALDVSLPRGEKGEKGLPGDGSGSVTKVVLENVGDGIQVSGDPITNSGTYQIKLSADVEAIEALSGTGYAYRTGVDEWELKEIDIPALSWDGIPDRPSEFTPSEHKHPASDITGAIKVSWPNVTEKPQEGFPPSEHEHDGYAPVSHKHDGYAPAEHQHAETDITGLGAMAIVDDAPDDGKDYVRSNQAWKVMPKSSGGSSGSSGTGNAPLFPFAHHAT